MTFKANIRGFNQRQTAIYELIERSDAAINMLQEQWLTPANSSKFNCRLAIRLVVQQFLSTLKQVFWSVDRFAELILW